ncbi:hypothetical protein [Pseudonocardia acidicola]|uniref:MFS transporter n=1 Tax=Pseudonocardia acidicola TaxID=2724939 RepID=A0ABX1SGD4_9PSEU|nr:hypothetical protein [Pseudonocardia acidicola]NMH99847.1 hypothetical protein [Pseudonocardia acidicola]
MTSLPDTTRIPVVPVLLAGVGAQLADDVLFMVLPSGGLLAPLPAALVLLLTAGAARLVTRKLTGVTVARTGLAVGAVSAGFGLLVGGFGLLGMLLATLTLIAGVAGAVIGRPHPAL